MKIKHFALLAIAASATIFFSSCEDNNPTPPQPTFGKFTIEFDHRWGMNEDPFLYKTPMLHPMSGDSLTTNLLKYYISNVVLTKADGSTYTSPNSYYLIDPENNEIEINNVPTGEYNGFSFIVGVDSTANCSGLQEGALSPSNGMFWSWSTGYIFVRIEGKSNKSANGKFLYHLGGYKSPYNAIQSKMVSFGSNNLTIAPNTKPTVHMVTNVAKLWHGPIKTADLSVIHSIGTNATTMATNFGNGIRFDHLHP